MSLMDQWIQLRLKRYQVTELPSKLRPGGLKLLQPGHGEEIIVLTGHNDSRPPAPYKPNLSPLLSPTLSSLFHELVEKHCPLISAHQHTQPEHGVRSETYKRQTTVSIYELLLAIIQLPAPVFTVRS